MKTKRKEKEKKRKEKKRREKGFARNRSRDLRRTGPKLYQLRALLNVNSKIFCSFDNENPT